MSTKSNYKPQTSQKNAKNICLKKISAPSAHSAVKKHNNYDNK